VAKKILEENKDILIEMTKALMEFETIDKEQIDDLMNRKPIRESAVVVDSEVVSTELGRGGDVTEDDNDSEDRSVDGNPQVV